MHHTNYEVIELHHLENHGDSNGTDFKSFVHPIVELLERDVKDDEAIIKNEDESFRTFEFGIRDRRTIRLWPLVKIHGEGVLFCSGCKIISIVQKERRGLIKGNSGFCACVAKTFSIKRDGVIYRDYPIWTFVAYIYLWLVVGVVIYVGGWNPAKRNNWFDITTDCMLVLITALGTTITVLGLGGNLAEKFWASLAGCSRWITGADIVSQSENLLIMWLLDCNGMYTLADC